MGSAIDLTAWQLASLGLTLLLVAGLDAPLAALALCFLVLDDKLVLRGEWGALTTGVWAVLYALLAVVQWAADVYFVPIRVRDGRYLDPRRTTNAYLHARAQSLLRPLIAAILVAALPTALPVQPLAVVGFLVGTAVYWFSAWVREYAALRRGVIVLVLLETLKHAGLLGVVFLMVWLPSFALVGLLALLLPAVWWTARLQREQAPWTTYGGAGVSDDA